MVQTTNQSGSESYSGKKIPRSKIRTGSIPVAGTKKGHPYGCPFLVLPNRTAGEIPGNEGSAAGGGRSDPNEWQRSIKSRKGVSPKILSGTATGCRQIGIRPIGVSFFDAVESNRRRKTTFSGRLFCIYSFIREQKYLSANTTPTVSKMLTAATRAERVAAWVYQLRTAELPMVFIAVITLCSSPA